MFAYSEETSSLLKFSTGFSMGCATPLHLYWLELDLSMCDSIQ